MNKNDPVTQFTCLSEEMSDFMQLMPFLLSFFSSIEQNGSAIVDPFDPSNGSFPPVFVGRLLSEPSVISSVDPRWSDRSRFIPKHSTRFFLKTACNLSSQMIYLLLEGSCKVCKRTYSQIFLTTVGLDI